VGMKARLLEVLERLEPMLKMHGGGVELVEINELTGVVSVRMLGKCVGCPLSQLTLKGGIEAMLKEYVKEVTAVIAIN